MAFSINGTGKKPQNTTRGGLDSENEKRKAKKRKNPYNESVITKNNGYLGQH